jgi:hypothetical protein
MRDRVMVTAFPSLRGVRRRLCLLLTCHSCRFKTSAEVINSILQNFAVASECTFVVDEQFFYTFSTTVCR